MNINLKPENKTFVVSKTKANDFLNKKIPTSTDSINRFEIRKKSSSTKDNT